MKDLLKMMTLFGAMLLLPISSLAQKDFREGYIVDRNKDTVLGTIAYKDNYSKYSSCIFRNNRDGKQESFGPSDLLGYGFLNDRSYESILIDISKESEAIFAEILVKGPLSLYKFREVYFVHSSERGSYYTLSNEEVSRMINNERYVDRSRRYIGTLSLLFNDCKEVKDKVTEVSFRDKSLSSIIDEYNRCKGGESKIYKTRKKGFMATFGFSLAYSRSSLAFSSSLDGGKELNHTPNNSIMPGAHVLLSSPKLNERLFFYVGAFYLSAKYESEKFVEESNQTIYHYVVTELDELKFPIGIRYAFAGQTLRPFVMFGASYNIHLNHHFYREKTIVTDFHTIVESPDPVMIPNTRLGIWGSVGVSKALFEKSSLSFEVRHEISNGVLVRSPDGNYKDYINNFQLLLAYTF